MHETAVSVGHLIKRRGGAVAAQRGPNDQPTRPVGAERGAELPQERERPRGPPPLCATFSPHSGGPEGSPVTPVDLL